MDYWIKYKWGSLWFFGLLESDSVSEEAEEAKATGERIVEDVMTGQRFRVPAKDVKSSSPEAHQAHVDRLFNLALLAHKRAKGLIGKLIRRPRGDGYAWYQIVQETPRTVTIEWRGYGLDRWYCDVLGGGGRFDKKLVVPLIMPDGLARRL